MQKQTQGFTLIEISIVLVIIGLLAGGILKGQQMIENTKYKAWVKQQDEIRVAVATFKDRYKYWPGDYPKTTLNGITVLAGDGDGIVDVSGAYDISSGFEGPIGRQHLLAAGLVAGDVGDTSAQGWDAAVGGLYVYLSTNNWGSGAMRTKLVYINIPVAAARRLDQDLDDGQGKTGTVTKQGPTPTDWPNDDSLLTNVYIDL